MNNKLRHNFAFILIASGTFSLFSCANNNGDFQATSSFTQPDNALIKIKTNVFSIDEPLTITANGSNENWVGLYGSDDKNPIYWKYLKDIAKDQPFNLRDAEKGYYHNGWEDINCDSNYSLKWLEKSSDGFDDAKYSVDIKFVNAPLSKPLAFNYVLKNNTDGFADGTITVKVDKKLVNNASIRMFWANDEGKLADYNALAPFQITNETTTFEMPSHVLIPSKATKLYVYTARNYNYSDEYLIFNLPEGAAHKDLGEVKFTYTVCSDTQLGSDTQAYEYRKLREAFKDIKSQNYNNQAILINGDVAEHGLREEFQGLMSTYNEFSDLPPMFMSIGNHELQYGTNPEKTKEMEDIFLEFATLPDGTHPKTINYDFWHNGYHFIMVGNNKEPWSHEIHLNQASLDWLDEKIGERYDPHRPTFIFMHQPIHNTVSGSLKEQGWHGVAEDTEPQMRAILAKYNKAILFSGHTHWVLDSFQNLYADDETLPRCLNTAAVAYEWTTYGNTYGAGRWWGGAEGYIMQIYQDKVVFRGRDYLNHTWVPSAYYQLDY